MVHEHLPQRAGKNLRRSIGRVDVSHLEQSRTPVLYVCGRAHPNVLAVNMRATHRFFLLGQSGVHFQHVREKFAFCRSEAVASKATKKRNESMYQQG